MLYALVAAVPIILTVVLMVFFAQPAKRAMPLAWLLTALIAFSLWGMGPREIAARSIAGCLGAFETICIIFGAILLMNILRQSGAMATINRIFAHVTRDARIQTVIVGYVFAGFIEGVAGFGSPAALAAPILISLGFPPLAAASVCLIYNSTPVCPGPVGVPTLTGAAMVREAVIALGGDADRFTHLLTVWTCIPHMIGGVVIIFVGVAVLCRVFGKNHSFRDALPALPFCLFTGFFLGTIYILTALFAGPELVTMTAFLGTLPVVILAARKGFLMPKEVWTFDGTEEEAQGAGGAAPEAGQGRRQSLFMSLLPYVVICIILFATRLNLFGLKDTLNADPFILHVSSILGFEDISWNFKFLYNPGILPFLVVAVLTLFVHRVDKKRALRALTDSLRQISGAAIALLFGVAMINIYRYTSSETVGAAISSAASAASGSSMLYAMANAVARLFSGIYVLVAPLIGVLGAFMSGSCTVSNTLFAGLQFEVATVLALPQVLIVALQNMGGAIGNMICINNIVAVCATAGTNGKEGRLIRTNILPCLLYALIVGLIVAGLIAAGVRPMPELISG